MRLIQSPEVPRISPADRTVFLAGSIDMGSSVDWQADLVGSLADCPGVLLNPRRQHWDPAWPADASSPVFREQVQWELHAMEAAGLIAFYFAPGSQAPVTLLELGLAARTGKAVVCCPDGYWRKGNVDVVCDHHGIRRVANIGELADEIRRYCETPHERPREAPGETPDESAGKASG
ncbi:MAG: hypothetical protein RLZZ618_3284 [Pseudomonadota bacterium]|jgi:hypothetical protein